MVTLKSIVSRAETLWCRAFSGSGGQGHRLGSGPLAGGRAVTLAVARRGRSAWLGEPRLPAPPPPTLPSSQASAVQGSPRCPHPSAPSSEGAFPHCELLLMAT